MANYLNVLLFSLLSIKEIYGRTDHEDDNFEGVVASLWLSVVFLFQSIFVPVIISIYYLRNNHRIKDKDFNEKVGSFIEGSKRKITWKALIVP